MSDSFASPTGINWSGSTGIVEYGNGDRGMLAMFYMRPVHNPAKSQEAGRPIYEDQIYVKIQPPGERLNIVDRPVQNSDKQRFPQQWAQFSNNKEQKPDGTPIEMLYSDRPSIGAMLKANGVFTIEQCAELSGPAIDNIGMGAQRYSNDAQKYIEIANKGVKASQLRHELEERDRQIRVLTQQVDQMKDELRRINTDANRGPTLAQMQDFIAGAMGRPQYPAGREVAGKSFDAATAQINATHATSDIVRQRQRAKPDQKAPSKRQRARVDE